MCVIGIHCKILHGQGLADRLTLCDMGLKDSKGRNGWQLCLISSLHRLKILLVEAKCSFWTCIIVYILTLPCLRCIRIPPWVHLNFVFHGSISPLSAPEMTHTIHPCKPHALDEASNTSQELARVRWAGLDGRTVRPRGSFPCQKT